MMGQLLVNLGAGLQAYEHPGYINVDIIESDDIHYVWDCNDGLPMAMLDNKTYGRVFKDSTVDEFLCHHFLEHLTTDGFMRLMDEMHDALKPDGLLHIFVPNGEHIRAAHSDPTHRMTFTKWTWEYFTHSSLSAFPYTTLEWTIDEGYPKVNGSEGDWWEVEVKMRPVKSIPIGE